MRRFTSGFSIVEIIAAAAIFVAAVSVFVVSFNVLHGLSARTEARTEAAVLLEEGAEAMLIFRDQGWSETIEPLALDTAYALYWDDGSYRLATGTVLVNGAYRRTVTLSSAYRNASGVFSDTGAIDPDTRIAVIEVRSSGDGELLATSKMLIHNAYE